jgi:hypothetical protein
MPLINYPPGSLLKQPGATKKRKKDLGRAPRAHDEGHLDAIRQCPCLVCGVEGVEAAHVRLTSAAHDKPNPGMAAKPDDRWCVPLCPEHHREQHSVGELSFWKEHGIDPLIVADRLHKVSPNVEAMRAMCFAAKALAGSDA